MSSFSKPTKETYAISPLGAAIVEALPDRAAVRKIETAFKRTGRCPVSAIFPTPESVAAYYARLNLPESEEDS